MTCDFCLKDLPMIILTLILAVATIYLAIYTAKLVNETRLVRKDQVKPIISIYLDHAETDPTLLFIVIQNIGQGIAYDLKFDVQKDFGDYGNEACKISERGLFKEGMVFCPPGFQKRYFLTETQNNYDKKMSEELIISAKYKDVFKENTEELFNIRLKEQKNYSVVKPAVTYIGRIAESLDQIKKLMKKE